MKDGMKINDVRVLDEDSPEFTRLLKIADQLMDKLRADTSSPQEAGMVVAMISTYLLEKYGVHVEAERFDTDAHMGKVNSGKAN
jgi:hypothetical protein